MKAITTMITAALNERSSAEKREIFPRFFKTGKGEYGEGDKFMGVTVPNVRTVAKLHKDITHDEIKTLLTSEWHEVRLCALLIMVEKCRKADDNERQKLFNLYLSQTRHINNWDLVDLSAWRIVGVYLLDKSREILSTFAFIREGQLEDTYALCDIMMQHPHDLMHKACGWMLREAGKRNPQRLYDYVAQHRHEMPRIMLRYAIEKFSPEERKALMKP